MNTTDMKAAIERVRQYCTGYTSTVPSVDFDAVLTLAEIGRLAVEGRMFEMDKARDAFLARREGDK